MDLTYLGRAQVVVFGEEVVSLFLQDETLAAIYRFCLPGVYVRGSKRSHTGKCVICHELKEWWSMISGAYPESFMGDKICDPVQMKFTEGHKRTGQSCPV